METKRMCEGPERLSSDRISRLPQPILETILCLLHTRDAVRTSILSRKWRYKWTIIPKLCFSHYRWCVLFSKQTPIIATTKRSTGTGCKSCYDIHQILLLHQGPIHELALTTLDDACFELDQIILYLSRNHTVKKLSFSGSCISSCWYQLPIFVFSFHHLTDLDLFCVDLDHPPIFKGFGSLQSLSLHHVGISTKTLLHLLSNCPSLKSLTMLIIEPEDKCTINELFKCLPVIEHLTTFPHVSEWLVLDSVRQELPTSLIHLKYFCFDDIFRVDGYGLAFLLVLIKCSPNLEKIKLMCESDDDSYEKYSVVWEEYSDVWLEHLIELEIGCFSNSEPEMEFVKFILARSPKLKKVSIRTIVDRNQESEMLKTLLQAPRASPVVITVW